MKQLLLALFVSFSIFVGGIIALLPAKTTYAQETIELNFGDVAKDNNVIGTENYESDDGKAGFGILIGQIIDIVFTIAPIIVFIMFLWGSIEWMTSGGDKTKIEKARSRITQSIIGMFVLTTVIAIFIELQKALNFEVFDFAAGTISNPPNNPENPGNPSIPPKKSPL